MLEGRVRERSRTATRPTPATCMGPLISRRQRDRVLGYIEKGKARGRQLLVGGGRPQHLDKGFFVEPTLFVDVDLDATIAQEEIFGPVLVRDPVRRTTTTRCASPTTRSTACRARSTSAIARPGAAAVARRIRTGTSSVNGGIWYGPDSPFGGYKQSGIGRENGVAGLRGVPRDQDARPSRQRA